MPYSNGSLRYLLCKLSHHVVVKPVEHDKEYTTTRREPKYAFGAEAVLLQQSILEGPHSLLLFPVASVQWCKIQIRRRLVDVTVFGVLLSSVSLHIRAHCQVRKPSHRLKDIVSDNGGQVQQHAAEAIGMRLELGTPSHELIKDEVGVRHAVGALEDQWLRCPCIRSICCTQSWITGVVAGAISFAVFVSVSQHHRWRMRQALPQRIDEPVS